MDAPDLPPHLLERARALSAGARRLLGITGPPAAGKSTLAAALVAQVPGAVLVPMDGFHLDDGELRRQGLLEVKGAPATFDAAGFVHLLRRLRAADEPVVYAPVFDRGRELSLAGALAVPQDARLVVTEGNYLLADGAFAPVRGLLHECWYVALDPSERRRRLVARHERHGRTPEQAELRATGSDEDNARLVEAGRDRADLVVPGPGDA